MADKSKKLLESAKSSMKKSGFDKLDTNSLYSKSKKVLSDSASKKKSKNSPYDMPWDF